MNTDTLHVRPVTSERWNDLAALFRTSAVTSSCWCMWPRVPAGELHGRTGEQNRDDLRGAVDEGGAQGLLAYEDGEAVGWCSLGPRRDYARFRSAGDVEGSWLIACLFVRDSHRGRGVAETLLEAAEAFAAERGAATLEGLPRGWRPEDGRARPEDAARAFRNAGFQDIDDPEAPAMMRKELVDASA